MPLPESVWVEPYPDEQLGLEDGFAAPDARYELRESVELAFVAALQHLPARQRAVLILREVLGYSAKEVAETLDTSVAGVNSALQRARATLDEKLPDRTQQATLRSLPDDELRRLVDRYVEAWERNDVDAVVELLTEDATISMPPLASWFGPRDAFTTFLAETPMSGRFQWRVQRTTANGQPALAYYHRDDDAGAFLPFALNVLTVRDGHIAGVVAFIVLTLDVPDEQAFHHWTDYAADERRLHSVFERFGLPASLPAGA
jgi:RNA polymerase sigma-70 factor (ECF subfamily)